MNSPEITETLLRNYPYPIAKCYERLIRTRESSERYDQGRYLFEVTTKYCAAIAIGQYLVSANADPSTDQALGCLTRPSMGHWLNLIRQCLHASKNQNTALYDAFFSRRQEHKAMIKASQALRAAVHADADQNLQHVSVFQFAETMVMHRNRTVGHGAPQRHELEAISPIVEQAIVEMILSLNVLTERPLVYLANITVHRSRFHHGITRLMGTAPLALPDLVTDKDSALLGHDGSLFLMDVSATSLRLSLHPLLILHSDEVFMLQRTDLARNVEYLCYHTGRMHEADHVFSDFKEKFARYLDSHPDTIAAVESENIYRACLTTSLVDGVIGVEERSYLTALAARLGIAEAKAEEMERLCREELSVSPENKVISTPLHLRSTNDSIPEGITAVANRHEELLRESGAAILDYLCSRNEPSKPIRILDLAAALGRTQLSAFQNLSAPQLVRLLTDIQNHGHAPGLVRMPGGYAVLESHIAFKINSQKQAKQEIAASAVHMISNGQRIGLDGGSTTLPIVAELIEALDSESLFDITVVTNSIPILRRLAEFIERRGWSDAESPIKILVCGGQMRAVTEAIAEPLGTSEISRESLAKILQMLDGLDFCFVGCNGITATDGLTMPTEAELTTKRQLLAAARQPIVVADASKIGMRYPVVIATWKDRLRVLMNRPDAANSELEAILAAASPEQVIFADHLSP